MQSRRHQSLLAPLAAVVVVLAALAGPVPAKIMITGDRTGVSAGPRATIRDTHRDFTLELPEGFVPAPDVLRRKPDMLYAYALGRRDSNGVSITLMIERLGRTLEQGQRLQRSHIPKDLAGELMTAQWNELTLDGFLAQKKYGHRTYLAYHVQVPLKQEAIQLELVGPATRKEELDAILRQVLDGLQGQSNWTPVAAGGAGAGSGDVFTASPRTVIIGVAVVGSLAAIPLFWPRRPRREALEAAFEPTTTSPPPPAAATWNGGPTPPPLPPRPPSF